MPVQLIYTLNALTLLQARDDPEYAAALGRADVTLADGVGCVWAARRLYGKRVERVTGLDLIDDLCRVCAGEGQGVYLLGGKEGVAARAAAALLARYPGLKVAGIRSGYWAPGDEKDVVAGINSTGAGLLLAGLGQPRQEMFLDRHRLSLTARVAAGVGGCFDVLAGDLRRAPRWIQAWGLEWLFRLIQEPRRAARIARLPGFVWWVWIQGRRPGRPNRQR